MRRGTFALESATLGAVPVPKSLLQELVTYYTRSPELPNGFDLDKPFDLPANIRQVELQRGAAPSFSDPVLTRSCARSRCAPGLPLPSGDLLSTPLQYVKGVGPRRAADFERVGLTTVEDLLLRFPLRYENRADLFR